MNQLQKFILRASLGIVLSLVLCRVFYENAGLPMVIGLAVILVGLSYVFEYLRQRKS